MTDPYLSWLRPDVAQGMHDLTSVELADESHPPYKYFLMAMREIQKHNPFYDAMPTMMIDAGCGVGHYGRLVAAKWPNIRYHGFDFSESMVAVAKAQSSHPWHYFFTADAKTFDYSSSSYDIVLASSLIEVMDQWNEGAEQICRTASNLVLLHRVRTHDGPTTREDHTGYPDQPTYAWVHNEAELLQFFLVRHFPVIWAKHWDETAGGSYSMATYIFKRM